MAELKTQIELIVSDIIGSTRKARTLEDLGIANTNGINDITNLVKNLLLSGVSSGFICVSEQEPPANTELIAQNPNGGNYLTSWRESYKIFMCQNKQDYSFDWKWKKV